MVGPSSSLHLEKTSAVPSDRNLAASWVADHIEVVASWAVVHFVVTDHTGAIDHFVVADHTGAANHTVAVASLVADHTVAVLFIDIAFSIFILF